MNILFPERSRHDISFRVGRFPVRVTPWFWIVQGAIGLLLTFPALLFATRLHRIDGLAAGLLVFPLWIACAFVSILIHELGHAVTGAWFGARAEIVLTALGGLAAGSAELYKRGHRIAVFLAGPAAQLLLAAAVWAVYRSVDPRVELAGGSQGAMVRVLGLLLFMNIAWPLLNLIPVPPLDGGQVAKEIINWYRFGEAPPWEQDANWWKQGASAADWEYYPEEQRPSLFRRVFPWTITATGVAFLLWWVYDTNTHHRQREAVATLQRLGGVIASDGEATYFGVNLSGRDVGDEELALLESLDNDFFERVQVDDTHITDAGLRHLGKLKGLHFLSLNNTQIGDEGLKHLAGLNELGMLALYGTRVTDAGLAHLEGMQYLQVLSLSRTAVSDAGIIHLTRLPSLTTVDLFDTNVTPAGIAELRRARPGVQVYYGRGGGEP